MHDEHLSKPGYRLDWQRVEVIIRQHFSAEDQSILFLLFGLNHQEKLTIPQIAKRMKLKQKPFAQHIQQLEKQLYKRLKVEDLDQLIEEHLEALTLSEEIAELQEKL